MDTLGLTTVVPLVAVLTALGFLAYRLGLATARRDLSDHIDAIHDVWTRDCAEAARAARAAERSKIAREMHDVVSHQVTLITMQANALAVTASPEATAQVAESIRELSTRTLEELRSLVGLLRSDPDTEIPVPGVAQLGDLVRDTDVKVRLVVERVPDWLPAPVSAAAYRTVQESLTNVHKHAPGAAAAIHVSYADQRLRIAVRNGTPATTPDRVALPSGGHGLAGLAERALLLDGTFHACATDEGGFEVRAEYPIRMPAPTAERRLRLAPAPGALSPL